MITNYKSEEEKHYDEKAKNDSKPKISYSDYVLRKSVGFYYDQIACKLCGNKELEILDFGCGSGSKHYRLAHKPKHITGIDISSQSIKNATQQAVEQNLNAEYLVMDCEKMSFSDNSFDLVFDFGTFSSLNVDVAIIELCRVMKKDGTLICIETYGHNPFMNLKRQINVLMGKRTKWASQHIMTRQNWVSISGMFQNSRVYYFHFLVLFLPVFLKILPERIGNSLLSLVEKIDSSILKVRFFQFLAFKTVVVLEIPKK
jgi:ubiquinone/menaquinone biosynthesis C-methylase UbiE